MSLAVQRTGLFEEDFANQFAWYLDEAGEEVAWRFHAALDLTLQQIARQPDMGRLRQFKNPRLKGLRSFSVESPFDKLLIFYRVSSDVLQAVRLMHGARDLPRRLREPPGAD